jgi:hypothetical protein
VKLAAAFFVVAVVAGCQRGKRSFHDTEGREFHVDAMPETWVRARMLSSATAHPREGCQGDDGGFALQFFGRYDAVCDAGTCAEASAGYCRPIVCESDGDCPRWMRDGEASTCLAGLCGRASHFIAASDSRLLCLAGTGAPATPPTREQQDRHALAGALCTFRSECRPATVCRSPGTLPPSRAKDDVSERLPREVARAVPEVVAQIPGTAYWPASFDGEAFFVPVWRELIDGESHEVFRVAADGSSVASLGTVDRPGPETLFHAGVLHTWGPPPYPWFTQRPGEERVTRRGYLQSPVIDGGDLYGIDRDALVSIDLARDAKVERASVSDVRNHGMHADETSLYFVVDLHDELAIVRVPKKGGPLVELARVPDAVSRYMEQHPPGPGADAFPPLPELRFAVDDERVYWTYAGSVVYRDGDNVPNADGLVQSVRKSGGPIETLVKGERAPTWLLVDADHLYWSSTLGVRRAPKGGGESELLAARRARDDGGPQLFQDRDHLYWINTDGEVIRVAKR